MFAFAAISAYAQQGGAVRLGARDWTKFEIIPTKISGNLYVLTPKAENEVARVGALLGPDGTFIVDASYGELGEKVAAAIKKLSNNAPFRFMVNTHAHPDHVGGNAAFGKLGAAIFARDTLRSVIENPAEDAPIDAATGSALPMITYGPGSPVTLHINGERVDLLPMPRAHTGSDTMVRFHRADAIMTGDVYRGSGYPNLSQGSRVNGMIDALGMAIGLCGPDTKVIPGHGPIGSRQDLIYHREMIMVVRDRVADLLKQGKTLRQVLAARPTADFDGKVLKDVPMYYDMGGGHGREYLTPDSFISQVYSQLAAKAEYY
jgi:glyoxylase-like metal-dependent hydrolase (beta-lactamase superfamily II)